MLLFAFLSIFVFVLGLVLVFVFGYHRSKNWTLKITSHDAYKMRYRSCIEDLPHLLHTHTHGLSTLRDNRDAGHSSGEVEGIGTLH